MNLKKKIESYTILETLVVLILSGIVFGLTYRSLHIVQTLNTGFMNRSEQVMEREALFSLMQTDWHHADVIFCSASQIVLQRGHAPVVTYEITKSGLVRNQGGRKDEFALTKVHIRKYRSGKEIVSNHMTLVDFVVIEETDIDRPFVVSALKQYSADQLIQYENNQDSWQ